MLTTQNIKLRGGGVHIIDNLHWTEVNGVTTVWTEALEPLRACLMFRTGRADETLITAGHTHLIEHMAMTGMDDFIHRSNGYVGGTLAGFVTVGHAEDVCTFFRKLCEGLASLPADRLEAEKKILLAEAAGRQYNLIESTLIWRYGATGYGLVGQPEVGIRGATLEQLRAWREQRFTRGNAILCLSGPVPADLRLDLPPGEKQACPRLAPVQWTFPSWFVDDQCGGIAASATVPRLATGPIFKAIAAKRMYEALRNKQAVSYSPTVFYDPLNADIAHLVLFADSEQGRRTELATAFGEVFEKLTEVDETEVEAARKLHLDQLDGPLAPPLADRLTMETQRAAVDWLFGRPYDTLDQLVEEACSVTADMVIRFAQVVCNNTIFAVPGDTLIAPWMGKKIPFSSGNLVEGREISHVGAQDQNELLVVGPEGVSIKLTEDSHVTVRYANLVAAINYDDGGLCLVGSDSTWLPINPTQWSNGVKVCEEVRRKIPPHLILNQGSRGSRNENAKPEPGAFSRDRIIFYVLFFLLLIIIRIMLFPR